MKKFIAMFMLVTVVFQACTQKEEKTEETRPVPVITTAAVERSYTPILNYSGTIQPNREANLSATLPGKVEKVNFKLGSQVKEGALLAELSGELLTQALVEHDALEKDFARISRLRDKGSMSQMEYDHLKAKLDASSAKVEMMRNNTQVVAPFSGTIVDIMVEEGENYSLLPAIDAQNLSISSGIIRLMQLNPVKVAIDVNEKELALITIGQPARITTAACPGRSFDGKVSYIKPFLSPASRTAVAEIELPNPSLLLKPGMYAGTVITLPAHQGIFVPRSAILRQPGTADDYVFTVIQGKAHKLPVKQLQTENDLVLIEGLPAGTNVITSGKSRLREGSPVEVKTSQPL